MSKKGEERGCLKEVRGWLSKEGRGWLSKEGRGWYFFEVSRPHLLIPCHTSSSQKKKVSVRCRVALCACVLRALSVHLLFVDKGM